MIRKTLLPLLLAATAFAHAEPAAYRIDPTHTFPSFEADHMGISVWRGKLKKSRGSVSYDKATGQGTVEITVELDSIDFGLPALDRWARGKDLFDTTKPANRLALYKGRFEGGSGGVPAQVMGEMTLHGVTRPLVLTVHSLKCMPHPMLKRDWCGADASGRFQRDEFGLAAGKDWGFRMDVDLRIQVEAVAEK